jgi:hypothetical protein
MNKALDAILKLEQEGCESFEEYCECMQALIDIGVIWHLQGSYQRAARELLNAGHCSLDTFNPVKEG